MNAVERIPGACFFAVVFICSCHGTTEYHAAPNSRELEFPSPNLDEPIIHEERNLPDKCPRDDGASNRFGDPKVVVVTAGWRAIVRLDPHYPVIAQERCISGWAAYEFTINADGSVQELQLIDVHPEGIFDRSSRRALQRWKYKPVDHEAQSTSFGGCAIFFYHHPLQPLTRDSDDDPFPIYCPYPTPESRPRPRGPLEVPGAEEKWLPLFEE
jgi:TonB family protein